MPLKCLKDLERKDGKFTINYIHFDKNQPDAKQLFGLREHISKSVSLPRF